MDPDACFNHLLQALAEEQFTEGLEYAEALCDWLSKGGFAPGSGKLSQEALRAFLDWLKGDLAERLNRDAS